MSNLYLKPDATNSINESIKEISNLVAKRTEDLILEQLNEFIKRDLIVIEKGPMTFVRNGFDDKLVVNQMVKLKLKDQDYIEKLEVEVSQLKLSLESIKAVLK